MSRNNRRLDTLLMVANYERNRRRVNALNHLFTEYAVEYNVHNRNERLDMITEIMMDTIDFNDRQFTNYMRLAIEDAQEIRAERQAEQISSVRRRLF